MTYSVDICLSSAIDGGRTLGETIIEASDINSRKEELFIKISVNGNAEGPYYELGYKVLPG